MSDHRDDGKLRSYVWQLLNQAEMRLVGVSQAALRAELYDTMRVFFDETNAWQESIKFNVVKDVLDYPIVPSYGRIIRLLGVVDQNRTSQPGIMPTLGIVSFQNPYSDTQLFTARVVLNVDAPFENRGVPQFPAWVLPQWGHYILDGLVSRMMMQPDKSWTDPQNGQMYNRLFYDGIGRVRSDTARANTIGAQAWTYPQTWRTTGQRGGVSVGTRW